MPRRWPLLAPEQVPGLVDAEERFKSGRDALPTVLPRFGISTVRTVQDIFLGRRLTRPTALLGRWWRRSLEARWQTSDHFFMADGDSEVAWWEAVPLEQGDTVVEVGVHPGTVVAWRAHELRGVERLSERLSSAGISPVRWRDLTRPD